ncbi:hypothetical protein ABER61_17885 [Brevibacillus formosus]|uniref:Uncharacterized protein n=1 Tax=Brevibacillus formosus TaxID=54913 RepID=A0A837KQC5_9BACL|nr:hypothetical protein [Brevibacillus formosus]KLH99161.1 hypothetical protein AA984_11640 [Brevibacillus formosus]MED1956555.1 hypothetical protein [Brevibacillus formosus]PSJ98190.1 hypothetical protein C7R91_08090 [Brevibacillus formosus]GED56944.1 hypothetical protein BFO01nite_10760 [Brevibacillus formosus]
MISINNFKSTKKIALATIGFITIAGLAVYYIGDLKKQSFLYSSDTDYKIVSGEVWFRETFNSVKGLAENADIIAEAEVISKKNNPNYERLDVYTVSELRLTKVYKGDVEIDETVSVLETGGEFDEREVAKYFSGKPGSELNDDLGDPGIIMIGLEGSIPMKEGNKYFVFLTEDDDDVYNIVGSVQGKIKINSENTLVSQVSPETIDQHGDLYFLQESYSGQDISELRNEVEQLIASSPN